MILSRSKLYYMIVILVLLIVTLIVASGSLVLVRGCIVPRAVQNFKGEIDRVLPLLFGV